MESKGFTNLYKMLGGKQLYDDRIIYHTFPSDGLASNSTPYIIKLFRGFVDHWNDGDLLMEIYTDGTLKPFEFNGMKFDCTITGSHHVPGSYFAFYGNIKYWEYGTQKEFPISLRDDQGYNVQEAVNYFFNEIIFLSQCGSKNNYDIVKDALKDIEWYYFNYSKKIPLKELLEKITNMCEVEKLIQSNNHYLPKYFINKLKEKLKDNISNVKTNISMLHTEL